MNSKIRLTKYGILLGIIFFVACSQKKSNTENQNILGKLKEQLSQSLNFIFGVKFARVFHRHCQDSTPCYRKDSHKGKQGREFTIKGGAEQAAGQHIEKIRKKIKGHELEFWRQFINETWGQEDWKINDYIEVARVFIRPDLNMEKFKQLLMNDLVID